MCPYCISLSVLFEKNKILFICLSNSIWIVQSHPEIMIKYCYVYLMQLKKFQRQIYNNTNNRTKLGVLKMYTMFMDEVSLSFCVCSQFWKDHFSCIIGGGGDGVCCTIYIYIYVLHADIGLLMMIQEGESCCMWDLGVDKINPFYTMQYLMQFVKCVSRFLKYCELGWNANCIIYSK